jgi:hypothetical protein
LQALLGVVEVGGRKETWGFARKLPEHQKIEVKQLADAALGAPNFAVYLVGGHIDKAPRDFAQERLES